MLNIAFVSRDAQLAETIKNDLMAARLTLDKAYLLVLVSAATLHDPEIAAAIQQARASQQTIVALQLEDVALPDDLQKDALVIDMRGGYHARRLVGLLKRADLGAGRLAANRFILAFLMIIVGLMFFAAVIGITGGLVRFPQNEYETEAALTDRMVQASLAPTLELLLPRTTQDANDFPATAAAVPTRIRPFLLQTVTALPVAVQATLDAIATSADQTLTAEALPTTTPRP